MTDAPIKHEYDPSNLDKPSLSVVEARDVVKKYGAKVVLDSVSFTIEPGSVFALLGENGSGKTTTARMILGETKPTSGQMRVFQLDPMKYASSVRPRVGYIPEAPRLYEYMTVGQLGRFAAAFNFKGYWSEYAQRCEELGLNLNARVRTLSKGMKAKTSLALELARDPEILVLDEPTSGLDALVRRQILSNVADLAAAGKAVFLSSHQTAEVERVADHVAFLKNGKFILMDSVENIKETTKLLSATIRGDSAGDVSLDALFASIFEDEYIGKERYGARYHLLGRGLSPNYEERLRTALGERLVDTSLSIPTLEDVFIAYMKK